MLCTPQGCAGGHCSSPDEPELEIWLALMWHPQSKVTGFSIYVDRWKLLDLTRGLIHASTNRFLSNIALRLYTDSVRIGMGVLPIGTESSLTFLS